MFDNKFEDAAGFEKVLHCVLALHNLKQLMKLDANFTIPVRRAVVSGEHIFTQKAELNLSIPKAMTPATRAKVPHIFNFQEMLKSAHGAISQALQTGGRDSVFTPTVGERGKNLYKGAYCLQLRVQEEDLGVWCVKFTVGASYSYQTHIGYFRLSQDDAAISYICDCYSG